MQRYIPVIIIFLYINCVSVVGYRASSQISGNSIGACTLVLHPGECSCAMPQIAFLISFGSIAEINSLKVKICLDPGEKARLKTQECK